MTTALTGAVELLDRSLAYTRVILAGVTGDHLGRPTPCADWSLGDLLAHLEDAFDVFTEAAGGALATTGRQRGPGEVPAVDRLQDMACALLGAWNGDAPESVIVAGHDLASDLLVAAAALEIAVHGWDVARALGNGQPVPEELARRLLPVARLLVRAEDRAVRFAAPRATPERAAASERLLAFLGRQ